MKVKTAYITEYRRYQLPTKFESFRGETAHEDADKRLAELTAKEPCDNYGDVIRYKVKKFDF